MKKQKNEDIKPQEEVLKETENNDSEEIKMTEKLLKDLDEKESQLKELSDKYIRLAAEYDNFRKRTQKEKEAIYTDAVTLVTSAWIPVIDNIERGLKSASSLKSHDARKVADGMEMILRNALDVIDTFGVKEVDALGQIFDPNTMEAVMHCEDENAGENEVVEVLTKGYTKGDRVIRHAIVKVAN